MSRFKTIPWTNPVFRWAGSKRKLLTQLLSSTPHDFKRYIEPFAGSACLFFALRPSRAILGDLNAELIDAYSIIRRHPRLVSRAVLQLKASSAAYYSLRAIDPWTLGSVERAARFVYLNRHCFNGVYRINRDGRFNVPRGTRTGRPPTEQDVYRCSYALRNATLYAQDYKYVLSKAKHGDFVYLDPPYAARGRTTYGEYGYDTFDIQDLPDLFSELRRLDKAGVTFLLSYCSHPALKDVPRAWKRKTIRVRRHVAGFATHRRRVCELLISNRDLF